MKKIFLPFMMILLVASFAIAQQSVWKKAKDSDVQLAQFMERRVVPDAYEVWKADFSALKTYLNTAPMEFSKAKSITFEVPLPRLGMVKFQTVHSPVYAAALAEKFNNFKTFSAVGGKNNEFSARFDYTQHGFHAIINTPNDGEVYIDPYATDQTDYYIVYFTKDHSRRDNPIKMDCGVHSSDEEHTITTTTASATTRSNAEKAVLRKYRLAVAASGEFTSKHGGTKSGAMSQIVTLVNRCTKKFNDELAMRYELIAKNDTVVFTNAATDPYKDGTVGKEILSISTAVISARVGVNNYDMGHSLTGNCSDVGGVANSSTVCGKDTKGQGMSCDGGGTADQFAVSIMCHEMGHQFSASHTMSACGGTGDQSQVASSSAIEPGSGTTIMSYDGGCGSDNVTGQYWKANGVYSVGSLEQIINFSRTGLGNTCAEKIQTQNDIPEVSIVSPRNVVIPILTPFELVGKVTDDSTVNYSWEQADEGQYVPLGSKKTLYANTFRVFDPVSVPNRIFPRLSDILGGKQTKSELYPDTSRTYTFRMVARDNNSGGGGTAWAETKFKSTHTAGPFQVTYPVGKSDTLANGEYHTIKWNVANTDNNLVNCKFVDILLSTDGGLTFPTTLMKNTPNDGQEGIILPNTVTSLSARVRVSAAQNIFFAINNKDFNILQSKRVGYTMAANSEQYTLCLPDVAKINIQTSAFGGFTGKVKLSLVDGLPKGAKANFSNDEINAGENATLSVDLKDVIVGGNFTLKIRSVAGSDTIYRDVAFATIYSNFDDMALVSPKDGETGLGTLPSFEWKASAQAVAYDFELATSPTFDLNSTIYQKDKITTNKVTAPITLNENTPYYWRVKASNACRNGEFITPNSFATLIQNCQVAVKIEKISINTQKNVYESTANVLESGKASDINVLSLVGNHESIGDLVIKLENPSGKSATLFNKQCGAIDVDFKLNFDDEAATGINCSTLKNNFSYKPTSPLSVFKDEEIKGTWKLKIEDTKTGDAGQLLGWNLRFCFAGAVVPPTLIKNDTLRVKKGTRRYIDTKTLSFKDDKTPDNKLIYTLVTEPTNGFVDKFTTTKVPVGGTFTQEELNNGTIIAYYNSPAKDQNTDFFMFVVTDGDGGFVGTLRYNIIRDENAPAVSTQNADISQAVSVYPNPTDNLFRVDVNLSSASSVMLSLCNMHGQIVARQHFEQNNIQTVFETSALPSGVYHLKINTPQGSATKKVIIQR
jgi:subtilisin-like proprotein convertase family protein